MNSPFNSIQSKMLREDQVIIDVINKSLKELFGVDTVTGLPIFRVVWSYDQMEFRHGTFDDYLPGTQIYIRTVTETREVPKYRQWVNPPKHILERLVAVPEMNQAELPNNKISYEPLWIFGDSDGPYIPPSLEACKFCIDTVLEAQAVKKMMIDGKDIKPGDRRLVKYADPDSSQEAAIANREARISKLQEELFGEESGLGTETFTESGRTIIVPHKQFGDK